MSKLTEETQFIDLNDVRLYAPRISKADSSSTVYPVGWPVVAVIESALPAGTFVYDSSDKALAFYTEILKR